MGVRANVSPGGLAKMLGFDMPSLKKQPDGTRWEIGFIIGRASAVKEKADRETGEVKTVLLGYFQGLNIDRKPILEAGECYLPSAMHKMIVGPLSTPGAGAIDFAIKLDAIEDKNAVTGYRYDCQPIGSPAKADPLAALREELGAAPAAIEDKTAGAKGDKKKS